MKAILTKFHGPTNTKDSRISATDCDGNKVTISKDHRLGLCAGHAAAAIALCNKMGWGGVMVQGALKNGFAFVFTGEASHQARVQS